VPSELGALLAISAAVSALLGGRVPGAALDVAARPWPGLGGAVEGMGALDDDPGLGALGRGRR
jgi:hypothetical protein